MTSTRRQTEIIAERDVPAVRIVREFDAPPERVFQAHVDPDLFAQWIGPRSIETRITSWDASTGGHWRYEAIRDGDVVAGFYGSFHEVRPPGRIVQTFTWDGAPDGVSLETLTLEALPGLRCRLTARAVLESFEARDAMLSSGMDVGVNEGYEKLDHLLANS